MSQSSWFAWACLLASAGMIALAMVSMGQAVAEPPPSFADSRYPALAKSQHLQEDFMSVAVPLLAWAVLAVVAYFMASRTSLIRRHGFTMYAVVWLAAVGVLAAVVGLAATDPTR